jgi:malate dehydrogenase
VITTTAAIIGAGELGGAVAHALARRESVSRVLLVDSAGGVAHGKALDIQQAGAIEGFHAQLAGTDDATRIAGCSVCIVADRAGREPLEWHDEQGFAHLSQLAPFIGEAPLVFAGVRQAPLMLMLAREAAWPTPRLIGSGSEALAAAVRAIVAMEARCSPAEVMLTVLGTPPAGFVVPWSEASIGGYALEHVLTPVQLTRIEARTARLWPPAPYTLALAAAGVTEAILRSSRRAFTVLTVLQGEFGVRGRVGALPVLLSSTGVVHTRVPSLSTRERVLLETVLGR